MGQGNSSLETSLVWGYVTTGLLDGRGASPSEKILFLDARTFHVGGQWMAAWETEPSRWEFPPSRVEEGADHTPPPGELGGTLAVISQKR